MKGKLLVFVMVYLFFCFSPAGAQEFSWENIGAGIFDCAAIEAGGEKEIFVSSAQNIFKTVDNGKSWRRVLSVGGRQARVYAIERTGQLIFAASSSGLYRSLNSGRNWERIFRGKNSREGTCRAVLVCEAAIFLGTEEGLFISRDNGRSWNKYLAGVSVTAISGSTGPGAVIYLAASRGIFKSADYQDWVKVFAARRPEDPQQLFEEERPDGEKQAFKINEVKADINEAGLVYFSSTQGVYLSRNQGQNWEKIPEYGLLNPDVKRLAVASGLGLLALCDNGVFLYNSPRWTEISFGLPATGLNNFCLDKANRIYIGAKNGVYRSVSPAGSGSKASMIFEEYVRLEPDIQKIQTAAVKYAEVDPEKIARWRRAAAKKALLPQVSVGVDRNSTDLWHWEGGSTTKNEDDCLRRGRDTVDWDVSLSWDLGELFFNDAQTSIDVRSKLMVELRNDILDQVNKLYFERLRLRSELDNLAIEDAKRRLEKQLKLAEITANLDALTGGYYSQQLRLIGSGKSG